MACLAILFCVDLSVYAVLTNKHAPRPDPEPIDAVADIHQDAPPPTPAPATPADLTATNPPAVIDNIGDGVPDPNYGLWEHTYGDYVVKTVRDSSEYGEFVLQIFQAGVLVYTNSSHIFYDPEKKDPEADDSSPQAPRPLTNITGNGIPNLVISEYSGGAHCCSTYHIYELGDEFREVDTIETRDGGMVFTNLTDSVIPEIQMADWGYAYVFTCFAASHAPDIVLQYTDGKYQVATNLMFTEPPTDDEFTAIVQEIKTTYATPAEGETNVVPPNIWGSNAILWDKMLDLTYQGHVDLALQLFDQCWQAEWKDRDAAVKLFWESVGGSQYGRVVVEAQGYELPQPEPDPEAVPAPTPATDPTMDINEDDTGQAYHIVDIGESLASIAKQHGVTVEALIKANNITNNRVYVAQKLVIPAK